MVTLSTTFTYAVSFLYELEVTEPAPIISTWSTLNCWCVRYRLFGLSFVYSLLPQKRQAYLQLECRLAVKTARLQLLSSINVQWSGLTIYRYRQYMVRWIYLKVWWDIIIVRWGNWSHLSLSNGLVLQYTGIDLSSRVRWKTSPDPNPRLQNHLRRQTVLFINPSHMWLKLNRLPVKSTPMLKEFQNVISQTMLSCL